MIKFTAKVLVFLCSLRVFLTSSAIFPFDTDYGSVKVDVYHRIATVLGIAERNLPGSIPCDVEMFDIEPGDLKLLVIVANDTTINEDIVNAFLLARCQTDVDSLV